MEYQKYVTGYEMALVVAQAPKETVHAEWDKLFAFLHSQFPVPDTAFQYGKTVVVDKERLEVEAEMVRELLLRITDVETLVAKITAMPPVFAEVVFPVAIARYLLRYCGSLVSPRKLNTFGEFYRRYGSMILHAVPVRTFG